MSPRINCVANIGDISKKHLVDGLSQSSGQVRLKAIFDIVCTLNTLKPDSDICK